MRSKLIYDLAATFYAIRHQIRKICFYKIPYLFDYKPSDFYTNKNWSELKFGL